MNKMHNPYEVHPRRALTDKQRLEMLIANKGRCVICGLEIAGYREAWDDYDLASIPFIDEHLNPLWLSGTNEFKNRGPAHLKCAQEKTSKEAGERSKVRASAEYHFGAKRAKTKPMPFGRRSKWKKKLNGEIVER